jgi:hypothetical protein
MLDLTTYKRMMLVQQTPAGATVIAVGATVPTISTIGGSIANSNDTDGQWLNFTTGNVSGNNGQVTIGTSVNTIQRNWQPEVTFHFKTGSNLAAISMWVCVADANMVGAANLDNNHGMGFRFDSTQDTNWVSVTGNNGGASSSTINDTGVAPATDTKYVFRMEVVDTSTVNFYINDVLVSEHTTSLPGASTSIFPHIGVRTGEAVAKNFKFSRWTAWQI